MSVKSPRRGIVLGGGGVLGAAWMIGALSALQNTLDWDPREAEVVVGTSAGSVLTAMLCSGLSVDTLVNHQRGVVAPGDPQIDFNHDTASGGALPPMPRVGIGSTTLIAHTLLHPRKVPLMATLAALAPRGRGSLAAIGDLVRTVNPAERWPASPEAWIVAMDYGSGGRVAFGQVGAPQATMSDAVMASCSIPGWYEPLLINGRRYVDGGTLSPTSIDLLADRGLDEVFVFAPMVSFDYDAPTSMAGRIERRYRRAMTRRAVREAGEVRRNGTKVTMLGPGQDDLEAIGINLMDHRRRATVLDTSLRTSAAMLSRAPKPLPAAG